MTEREYDRLGNVSRETRTFPDATGAPPHVYTTDFVFDSFGRLLKLTYPDGEIVRHTYDSGGNVTRIEGEVNGKRHDYLSALEYDRFEQRTHIDFGNGVASDYAYNPLNRRLTTLVSKHGTAPAAPTRRLPRAPGHATMAEAAPNSIPVSAACNTG